MSGVIHTNPRPFDDGKRFGVWQCGDEKIVAEEIVAVEAAVNMHCPAE